MFDNKTSLDEISNNALEVEPEELLSVSSDRQSSTYEKENYTCSTDKARGNRLRDDNLDIGQAEFGYIDEELQDSTGYGALETGNIATCIGCALSSYNGEYIALAHTDMAKKDQIKKFVNRSTERSEGEFDRAMVVASDHGDKEEYKEIVDYLNQEFAEVQSKRDHGTTTLGVDNSGFYQPKKSAKRDSETIKRMLGRAFLAVFNIGTIDDKTKEVL